MHVCTYVCDVSMCVCMYVFDSVCVCVCVGHLNKAKNLGIKNLLALRGGTIILCNIMQYAVSVLLYLSFRPSTRGRLEVAVRWLLVWN